jgi:hypothetical protein
MTKGLRQLKPMPVKRSEGLKVRQALRLRVCTCPEKTDTKLPGLPTVLELASCGVHHNRHAEKDRSPPIQPKKPTAAMKPIHAVSLLGRLTKRFLRHTDGQSYF